MTFHADVSRETFAFPGRCPLTARRPAPIRAALPQVYAVLEGKAFVDRAGYPRVPKLTVPRVGRRTIERGEELIDPRNKSVEVVSAQLKRAPALRVEGIVRNGLQIFTASHPLAGEGLRASARKTFS